MFVPPRYTRAAVHPRPNVLMDTHLEGEAGGFLGSSHKPSPGPRPREKIIKEGMMIKFGVIGCGFMGKMHSNCYKVIPGCQLVGVADIRLSEAKAVAKMTGCKIYKNADALINDPSLDAVDVCVPTYLHKQYTLKAAKAGKHVFCEKPMARNPKDAAEMVRAVRKAGVKMMLGMVCRFWPEYVELKKIVDSKKYGRLTSLVCTRIGSFPAFAWNNWYGHEKLSGGAALDLHIHDTDYITYLLGQPKSVNTTGTKSKRGWDHVFTTYEYPDTAVYAEGGWDLDPGCGFSMNFRARFADNTVVEYASKDKPMTLYRNGKSSLIPISKVKIQVKGGGNISDLGGYYNEVKYWADCLKAGKKPTIVTAESALKTLGVVFKEFQSLSSKKKVAL